MRNIDILTMCLRNLFKRKLRTFLTMTGVMIGTVAIVVTVSLGLAVNLRFQQQIEQMGDATVIAVFNPNDRFGMRFPGDDGPRPDVPDLDGNALQRFVNLPNVIAATPIMNANLFFRSGNYVMQWSNVVGISPGAMEAFGYIVQEGRTLQEGDTLQAVFGYHAEKNFEDPNSRHWNSRLWDAINGEEVATYVDIFNDRITMSYDRNFIWNPEAQEQEFDIDDIDAPRPVRPMVVEVVGVLEVRNDWGDIDGAIFMDIATVQRLSMEAQRQEQQNNMDWGLIDAGANARQNTGYDRVLVRVANINAVQGVREQIEEMGFPANSPTQWLEPIQEMARSQQQMLGAIGAVSLFVAAIGIANTMVMSIYERTREIGVMKVIGAALPDIRKLFLMEAAMIGFFGGIIGVLVSYLVSYLLNNHTQVEFLGGMFDWIGEPGTVVSLITPWLSGLALLFASLIGLLSGYFPARRAMRLSALSAIRTE